MKLRRAGLGLIVGAVLMAPASASAGPDHASGSVESTLRGLISIASTGFNVIVQKKAGSATNPTSTNNPKYTLVMILDGDLNVLDETIGDISKLPARFVSYDGAITISTTATS